jgi:type I restriction enzyme S subunit
LEQYQKIRAEKKRLIKEKKIKPDKKKSVDKSHYGKNVPFVIPKNWEWVKIKDIFQISPKNNLDDNTDVSFIPMQLISGEFTNEHKSEIKKWKDVKKGFTHFQEGDVAIAKITPCFENRKSVILNNLENCFGAGTTELHILRPILEPSIANYTLCFVKSEYFINHGISQFSGAVGQQRVGRNIIEDTWFPLPPFSEQNRIVAEVERLFALIDIIEQSKFSIEQDVKQTKSKVIDLAIRGKLVPQDLNDEPASVLIEKTNKVEKSNKTTSYKSHYPFEVPSSWQWCRFGEINDIARGGSPRPIKNFLTDSNDGVNWIKIGDAEIGGKYIYSTKEKITKEGVGFSRYVNVGDFLLTNSMSFGRPYILKTEGCIHDGWLVISTDQNLLDSDFMYYLLSSDFMYNQFSNSAVGSTVKNLKIDSVKLLFFPLPPFAEQKRIVSQIEKIFTELDVIEDSLKA